MTGPATGFTATFLAAQEVDPGAFALQRVDLYQHPGLILWREGEHRPHKDLVIEAATIFNHPRDQLVTPVGGDDAVAVTGSIDKTNPRRLYRGVAVLAYPG